MSHFFLPEMLHTKKYLIAIFPQQNQFALARTLTLELVSSKQTAYQYQVKIPKLHHPLQLSELCPHLESQLSLLELPIGLPQSSEVVRDPMVMLL